MGVNIKPIQDLSYYPSDKDPYMGENHLEFFKNQLLQKRDMLENEWQNLNKQMNDSADMDVESFDKASNGLILLENITRLEVIQKSLESIEVSLNDIEMKKYGFCKKTGKVIGLQRLIFNPEAKFCIEAQEDYDRHHDRD